jgi:hypothetical protein
LSKFSPFQAELNMAMGCGINLTDPKFFNFGSILELELNKNCFPAVNLKEYLLT